MKTSRIPMIVAFLVSAVSASAQKAGPAFEEMVYKSVGDTELKMRVYQPKGWKASDERPAIVFFFGGGWRNGTPDQFDPHCRHLAAKGMVAMAADYRVQSKHDSTPFESTRDAKSAIRWVRANAGKLGIDPDRVGAGGGSAGGHLAAATATILNGVNEKSDDKSISAVPDALVLFNPAVDLDLPKVKERWGDEVYARIKTISPYHHLSKDLPPTIIFHGTNDDAVPFETVEAFEKSGNELGVKFLKLESYEGRPHGFFNFGRGDGKDYEDTVARMDDFLAKLGWIEK